MRLRGLGIQRHPDRKREDPSEFLGIIHGIRTNTVFGNQDTVTIERGTAIPKVQDIGSVIEEEKDPPHQRQGIFIRLDAKRLTGLHILKEHVGDAGEHVHKAHLFDADPIILQDSFGGGIKAHGNPGGQEVALRINAFEEALPGPMVALDTGLQKIRKSRGPYRKVTGMAGLGISAEHIDEHVVKCDIAGIRRPVRKIFCFRKRGDKIHDHLIRGILKRLIPGMPGVHREKILIRAK
ncbi:MAG: hypothetical protein BWY49_00064 [Candidatus Omnitrophica bacterium ADurb.Bin314]|nr:MAG: hypothetical protein BWY49_00064 [Candidatus Omnitrophica bacterium ADurb.Bin314]